MRTIWKVVLKPTDVQHIEVPMGAELLYAREQFQNICIWYRCDPSQPKESRLIAICGTGHPAPDDEGKYIGTASLQGGALMLHVFALTEGQQGK